MTIDLYKVGTDPASLRDALILLRQDFDSHDHDGVNSKQFQTVSAETLSAHTILIRKTSYTDTTNGWWSGLVGSVLKWYLGDGVNFIKWDGSSVTITGSITGSTITGGSLNIGNGNFTVDSNGYASAVGFSSLNLKAYTNFEASGRFISTLIGTGTNSFGNQGVTVAPGATGTSSARLLWWISNYVFNNNPTFTVSILALGLNAASGSGASFVGLGNPSVSGSGYVFNDSHGCAGFLIQKASPIVNVYALQQKGDSTNFSQSSILTTLSDGDSLELFLKFTSTGVNYYFRKNGSALSSVTTLSSTSMPTASENFIHFSSSNIGSAVDFQVQFQCAAYEH